MNLMAQRVVANLLGDPDMSNTFPPGPPLQEMADAASGAYQMQPHRTLRERGYGVMPLVVRPEYSGDFLDKLRDAPRVQGKPLQAGERDEAEGTNLQDFSAPDGMLKHEEGPTPRDLTDEFYDVNRPGEQAGYEDLKQYWDRSWDPWNVPEVSEDAWLRRGPAIDPDDLQPPFQATASVRNVVAAYLFDAWPVVITMPDGLVRVAKTLADLQRSKITTKTRGTRTPDGDSVTWVYKKKEPNIGKWTYETNGKYITVFQFIPSGNIVDPTKLQVRVSCSCDSWIYWGAQYNAHMGGYLQGPIRLKTTKPDPAKFSYPKERDPMRQFLCCKHVLACIPDVSKQKLGTLKKPIKVRLQMRPKLEIEMERRHERAPRPIPQELRQFGFHPDIHNAVSRWKRMSDLEKENFIKGLDAPGEVAYMGHAIPEPEVMALVIDKLTDMAHNMKDQRMRMTADELLRFWLAGGAGRPGAGRP